MHNWRSILTLVVAAGALALPYRASATGVPIGGFLPFVGIGLTNEFDDDLNIFAVPSLQPGGSPLGPGGTAYYDLALLDTGAGVSALSSQGFINFNMAGPYPNEPDGFAGTETIPIGGATGGLFAEINDPVGLYAAGLQNRTGTNPLVLTGLRGQTNTSTITIPPESELPNIVGLPFIAQYATYIRNDMPQLFELNGQTVRAPHIEFLPLGSGGQGIARRATLTLNPGDSFLLPPFWLFNLENLDIDNPHENPSQPTALQAGLFLNVSAQNDGQTLSSTPFLLDTGADVTVMSEANAALMGFDVLLDEPEFTLEVIGVGGSNLEVPGFFADQLTVFAVGGNVTLTNVPIVVLDVPNPGDLGNVVPGIVGTNLLAGRNVVIDPNPSTGMGGEPARLYIGDPVTTQKNWISTAASSNWNTAGNWNGSTTPTIKGIANVRHVSGGNQTAVVTGNTTAWELNVSGSASQTMTVRIANGARLTTFSGVNVETNGILELDGGTLDAQFVQVLDGTLRGSGLITTGSGPIPGQVESRNGRIEPGNSVGTMEIIGRFANGAFSTLSIEIGGTTPGTQHDQLIVDGAAALGGKLEVLLVDLGQGLFAPPIGAAFKIISATDGIGGAFDTLSLPGGFNWNISYSAQSVDLIIGVPGDYNDDGVVNAADYTVWRNTLGSMSMLDADGDGSGQIDAGDYQIWKNSYGMTMPQGAGSAASATTPEPASAILALAAALAAAASTRMRFGRA